MIRFDPMHRAGDGAPSARYDPQALTVAKSSGDGEAPASAPFERWAWPTRREGVDATEPENDAEERVFKSLRQHFRTDHVGLPREDADLLHDVLRERTWYSAVLHPPPNARLYRGIRLASREDVAEFVGVDEDEIGDVGSSDVHRSVTVDDGFSTSWSAKKKIARDDFAKRGKRGWAVTLTIDVKKNKRRLLAGPGGLYDVRGMSRYHLEKETVALEPVIVRRIEWQKYDDNEDASARFDIVSPERARYWGLAL